MKPLAILLTTALFGLAPAAQALDIRSAVIRVDAPKAAPISRLDQAVEDDGFAGGQLATEDNQTTGSFMGMAFETDYVAATPETALDEAKRLYADGVRLFVVQAEGGLTGDLADAMGAEALILNAGTPDMALRDGGCRANLFHVSPSHAMRADAIAQFAIWKKWPRWLLVHGSNPEDKALADAYRRAARKFGAKIVEEREFEDTGGSRRTDTGHVLVQRQLPVFMQDTKDHDVVITADASDVFAPYLPYHLWDPRPVLGSGGLRAVSMTPTHEAWGATQFQTRFEKLTRRYVREADYHAWLALRVIGEAVIRTNSADPATLREYMLSDAFELAAFKGQKVTFRSWNGQLRQPILLSDARIVVSVSPQDGFLHQRSPLDSLGLDQPESACAAFE